MLKKRYKNENNIRNRHRSNCYRHHHRQCIRITLILSSNNSKPSPTPTPTPTPTTTPTPHNSKSNSNAHGDTLLQQLLQHPPYTYASSNSTWQPQASWAQEEHSLTRLMQTWVSTYQLIQTHVSITYNAVGSGTGITQFQQQLTNFGETDVPLSASNIAGLPSGTTALTVPISASAIVPAYNIQLINGSYCQNGLNFTGTVLANIFLGTITKWNDPQITALQSPSYRSSTAQRNT